MRKMNTQSVLNEWCKRDSEAFIVVKVLFCGYAPSVGCELWGGVTISLLRGSRGFLSGVNGSKGRGETSDKLSEGGEEGFACFLAPCSEHCTFKSYCFWISISAAYDCSPSSSQVCDKMANAVSCGSRSTKAQVRVSRKRMLCF